jgi:hypothetical protein
VKYFDIAQNTNYFYWIDNNFAANKLFSSFHDGTNAANFDIPTTLTPDECLGFTMNTDELGIIFFKQNSPSRFFAKIFRYNGNGSTPYAELADFSDSEDNATPQVVAYDLVHSGSYTVFFFSYQNLWRHVVKVANDGSTVTSKLTRQSQSERSGFLQIVPIEYSADPAINA